MKTLPLLMLSLLLLAGTALADDELGGLQQAVAGAADHVAQLEAELGRTEDPAHKASLLDQLKAARAEWDSLRLQLSALQLRRQVEQEDRAKLHAEGQELAKKAWADEETLEGQLLELMRLREAMGDADTAREEVRHVEVQLQRLRDALSQVISVRSAVDEARTVVEHGRYDQARRQIEQARQQYEALRSEHFGHEHLVAAEAARRFLEARKGAKRKRAFPLHIDRATAETDRKRIEHLRTAAHHLREAGLVERAESLEGEVQRLEQARKARQARALATALIPEGEPGVLGAVQDLRREVRQLREEVRELKAILLEDRDAR